MNILSKIEPYMIPEIITYSNIDSSILTGGWFCFYYDSKEDAGKNTGSPVNSSDVTSQAGAGLYKALT